jgi:hypothetical protein
MEDFFENNGWIAGLIVMALLGGGFFFYSGGTGSDPITGTSGVAPKGAKVTETQYNSVKEGMTEEEVLDMLGKPNDEYHDDFKVDQDTTTMSSYTYRADDDHYTSYDFDFMDGELITKSAD